MAVFKYLPQPVIHFSNCLNTALYDSSNKYIGKLADFFVDYEEQYPTVIAILFKKNQSYHYIKWEDVQSFSYKRIVIRDEAVLRSGKIFPKVTKQKTVKSLLKVNQDEETIDYPPIGRVILDKQIVDTFGKKVVRVNDIHFIKVGKLMRVTHAAVGLKSMLRRLGYDRITTGLLKAFTLNKKTNLPEKIISWRFVHAIADHTVQENVSLNVSNEDLGSLHPADLADILEELDGHGRANILKSLDPDIAADTIAEIEEDMQATIIKNETPQEAAKILEKMGTDEAVDILDDLTKEERDEIISHIEDNEIKQDLRELLNYPEDTAGGLMSTDPFVINKSLRKDEILEHLVDNHEDYENIYDIYVIDENEKLVGTCSLRKLITQKENIKIEDIMNTEDMQFQTADVHWKDLSEYMSKYNLINVPIVDSDKKVLGFVSVDDVLPWLIEEM